MRTYIRDIGNIEFRPSMLFKPYSMSWTRTFAFGHGYPPKTLDLPRRKYFGDFHAAVLFRRWMLANFEPGRLSRYFYLQSEQNWL
ncbi:MAG: hypothetical protein LBL21_00035 [Rickettsiales bacterium]|jgi:hypothetical protein|nr:hypothetical protein [Rickettsiales bacterium]